MYTPTYGNRARVRKVTRGYCVTDGAEQTNVFFPEDFKPDEQFEHSLAEYQARVSASLVWIENPGDDYKFWRCASVGASGGSIRLGKYAVSLWKVISKDENKIVYDGGFSCGGEVFSVSDITLDLADAPGTLSFTFTYEGGKDVFDALDAGIKYVMPLPEKTAETVRRGFASIMASRVLSYAGNAVFSARVDPCALFDIDKTNIRLPGLAYDSCFSSATGAGHKLTPKEDAALVFERSAVSVAFDTGKKRRTSAARTYYLGFSGTFGTNEAELLTGLFGSEFVRNADTITFIPHKNAFLEQDTAVAENDASTAWLSVRGSYYSLAESAPLYKLDNSYLRPYSTPAALFTELSPAFPAMPWRASSFFDVEEAESAEQLLYQTRYGLLTDGIDTVVFDANSPEMTLVTPNGLCIGADEETEIWKWLGIAQTSADALPDIRLNGLSGEARIALMNKECLIVLSSVEEFSEFAQGEIKFEIDGWQLQLSQDAWRENAAVIIKYNTSMVLTDDSDVNHVLGNVLEDAYNGGGGVNPGYEEFARAVTDPSFEGILILNAKASTKDLPAEVKAIAGTIDPELLRAAYIVIDHSRISIENGAVCFSPTPISGLIAYKADEITDNPDGKEYLFKTVKLDVLFENSHVADFSCRSELLPTTLMGEALQSPACLILSGRLEESAGVSVYRFALEDEVKYAAADSVVDSITVRAVNLSADSTRSVFRLTADAAFMKDANCDVFSYERLYLNGIDLIMEDGKDIYADYSGLTISGADSETREGSLAEMFGSSVTQYLLTQGSKSPDELGFNSITSPVKQGSMDAGWNGIIHKIALGGSGALGDNGLLDFEFITAWKGKNCYIGIRLSGIFQKSFSIQGIIQLGFTSMELKANTDGSFCFQLHNLAAKAFGLSFPQRSADLYVFGEHGKTGWYLGYAEEKAK